MEVKKLNEFILEAKDASYDSGCMMLYINLEGIDKLHKKIEKKDIFTGEESDNEKYGIESEIHITVKYGFTDKVSDHDVLNDCRDSKMKDIKFNKISLFENDKYDVLKFDIDNTTLNKLNEKISKYPNNDKYPKYHAHSTIAYIKKGKGQKYVDMFKDTDLIGSPDKWVYSNIDGTKLTLDIKK